MNEKSSGDTRLVNVFDHMWLDSLESQSNPTQYREMWNGVVSTDEESTFGVSNEPSNVLFYDWGGTVLSLLYVDERDYYLSFVQKGDKIELGKLSDRGREYEKITDLDCEVCSDEYINATYKFSDNCDSLYLYFSINNSYYYLNIDDPCCDFSCKLLFDCKCPGLVETQVVDGGNLPNGVYYFFFKIADDEGNDTNYFKVFQPVTIAGGCFRPGESSEKSIHITVNDLPTDYGIIELGVISVIEGQTASRILTTTSYGDTTFNYTYIGESGQERGITIEEILSRNSGYYTGKNLMQYDGRLVLYELTPERELDYQLQANEIKLSYRKYALPVEEAKNFKGLRPNEKYMPAIRWNYCDGTSSSDSPIPGREATGSDLATVSNCKDCELPRWRLYDTSFQTKEHCTLDDLKENFEISSSGHRIDFRNNEVHEQANSEDDEEPMEEPMEEPIGIGIDPQCTDCDLNFTTEGAALDVPIDLDPDLGVDPHNITYRSTGVACNVPGEKHVNNNTCYECRSGEWYVADGATAEVVRAQYSRSSGSGGAAGNPVVNNEVDENCNPKPFEPILCSEGEFGYWETEEVYPDFINPNTCEPVYGDLAGKPIRLPVVPSITKECHFTSLRDGVPTEEDIVNDEMADSFVYMIGLCVTNVQPPKNPPKPLCEHNPYTITYVERTDFNKSVLGSAIAISMFKGDVQGETHLIPKNGLNSFEFYDRSINPAGDNTFRGGYTNTDSESYVLHSPDLHLLKPTLDASHMIFETELSGLGYRYGLYDSDEEVENWYTSREHQSGNRAAINLSRKNKLKNQEGDDYIIKCINGISKIDADTRLDKSNKFKYSVLNRWRESAVFVELDSENYEEFNQDAYGDYGGGNGSFGAQLVSDQASDNSFIGDVRDFNCPLLNNRAFYVTLLRYLPNQYGGLIGQTFIPIGLEATSLTDSVCGLVGDSFTNGFDVKRTSYVSDKVPEDITPLTLPDGVAIVLSVIDEAADYEVDLPFNLGVITPFRKIADIIIKMVQKFFEVLYGIIGYEQCGDVPTQRDFLDPRVTEGGLRDGDCWGSLGGAVPTPSGTDIYYPNLLKTNIHFKVNSDANLAYRQTGEVNEEIAEVHIRQLKGLNRDSDLPKGSDWRKSFLNRFYVLHKEPPKWKTILKVLFHLIWTFGIAFFLLYIAIKGIIESIATLYIDAVVVGSNAYGIIIAIAGYLLLAQFAVAWIGFWTGSDKDTDIINKILGLENCTPDIKNPDDSYSIFDDRVRQFEDNYMKYNIDYSRNNIYERGRSLSTPEVLQVCDESTDNRIIYSDKQVEGATNDMWRNFRVNNNLSIPKNFGNIKKVLSINNNVLVHTDKYLVSLQTGSENLITQDGTFVYLGSGDLFRQPFPIYGGVEEGYGGLLDPNAAKVTRYGYIFPDRNARKWYTYGNGLTPISDMGVKHFMDNNMYFKLLETFPDYDNVDNRNINGIGFSFGVDPENGRLLFTKIDYEPLVGGIQHTDGVFMFDGKRVSLSDTNYFRNVSFTLSYSIAKKKWISFHSYHPLFYMNDRFNFFSIREGMWKHNVHGDFQTFYGKHYPFSVDFIATNKQNFDSFQYNSSVVNVESYKWNGQDYCFEEEFFDKILAYNSHQMSGIKQVKYNDHENIIDRSKYDNTKVSVERRHRIFNFSEINDHVIDRKACKFDLYNHEMAKQPTVTNLKGDINKNIFTDNYFGNRLIFSKFNDVKILLTRVETEVEYKSR